MIKLQSRVFREQDGVWVLRWQTANMAYPRFLLVGSERDGELLEKGFQLLSEGKEWDPPVFGMRECMCGERIPFHLALKNGINLTLSNCGYDLSFGPLCRNCAVRYYGVYPEGME